MINRTPFSDPNVDYIQGFHRRLGTIYTSVKIIKNEVGCRDDTVPKTVDTRRHCEEE